MADINNTEYMKLVVDNEDDFDKAIGRVTKVIMRESKELEPDQSSYYINICLDDDMASSSTIMQNLLSHIPTSSNGRKHGDLCCYQ